MDLMYFMEKMGTSDIALIAAFFIGLMMSISPCPLATNITAIAYISRKIESSRYTLTVGLIYSLGRSVVYVVLASLIIYIGANTQEISFLLQEFGEKFIGEFLIFLGILLLGINRISFRGSSRMDNLKGSLAEKGMSGSFVLGMVFALAFCPFSAVLFFGMLMPIALQTNDGVVLPSVFGIATGVPVLIASALLTKSISTLGKFMNSVQAIEEVTRKIAALVFIMAGVYHIAIPILQA